VFNFLFKTYFNFGNVLTFLRRLFWRTSSTRPFIVSYQQTTSNSEHSIYLLITRDTSRDDGLVPPWALVVNTLETGFIFTARRSKYEQTAHGFAIHRVEEMDAYEATKVSENRRFQTVRRKTTYVAQLEMIQ